MLVGEVFAKMGLDSKQYEKGLDRLEGYTEKKAITLGSIFKGAFSFALGMGLVSGFRSLGGAITDFVNTAARTDVLNIAMLSVASSSGYMRSAVEADKKAVMELGIAEQEATQITTRFMQAQLDTADAAKLARAAQDAAVLANTNSSAAALQMTDAIAKLRPELLEQFGMTKNLVYIYQDYAKTVGKTANQLSEAEKKQAMLNYILAEGEKIAGTYEASMGAVGKQIGSLPRYWDTLKNALAKPLALPALNVIVDGITNSLKNAIGWAEENELTLQRWGQTASNVASFIIRAFQYVSRVFVENWAMIRFAATALLTYAVATKVAAGATAVFQAVQLALNGQLLAQIPVMKAVRAGVLAYWLQMAAAPAATNLFTAALIRLRAALYAVHVALGPIGWAILLISGLIAGGMALWNKYNQSLQKTASLGFGDFRVAQDGLAKSTGKAAGAIEDEADALKKAGKAAGKNLQSFDEVHQLQEDMAGSAEDLADSLELDDVSVPGVGGFEIPDMGAQLEEMKPTLAGFWEWIKQGAGNLWEGIKTNVQTKWEELKTNAPVIWENIKTSIRTRWENLKTSAGETWSSITTRIEEKWNNLKTNAPTVWENIKTSIQDRWDSLASGASEKWGNIKSTISEKWEELKTNAPTTWENIKKEISDRWENLKTNAPTTWENIKTSIQDRWEALKTNAPTAWENIRKSIDDKWEELKTNAPITWEEIKKEITDRWEALKKDAPETWENIKKSIAERWEELKVNAPTTWENIKKEISDRWEALKTNAPIAWNNISKTIKDSWEDLKTNVPTTWNDIKEAIADKWQEIKDDAFSWGKNLIDGFVQGVKDKTASIKGTLKNVGNTIENFLGFSSPTKEGPGRFADEWAPNLMNMFAEGLNQNIPKVRSAADEVAQQLTGMTVQPTVQQSIVPATTTTGDSGLADTVAQAVYQAIMDAMRISQASSSQSSDDKELVLKIDNTVLARMQLPAIIREGQRQGLNLVVQPQGV